MSIVGHAKYYWVNLKYRYNNNRTYFSCLWRIDFIQNRSQRRHNVKFTIDSHRGDEKSKRDIQFHGGRMDVKRKGESDMYDDD